MSFLTAKTFVFNGINSEDYNVIIGWIDSQPDVSTNGLNIEVQKSSTKKRITDNIYGSNYTDNIKFNFSIVRIDGAEIIREESIRINQWLTSSPLPQLLKFNDCDDYMLHYYAVCTVINDIVVGGRLIGKELTFETNSSCAFMNKVEKSFDVVDTKIIYINNTSDTSDGIYYPTITLSSISDSVVIENVTDKKSMTIDTTNVIADETGNKTLKLDCMNMTIVDSTGKLVYASDIGWNAEYKSYVSSTGSYMNHIYWLRLLKGMNELKITGNCTFKIECEFPRKAGCL